MTTPALSPDPRIWGSRDLVVCFSHLRWDFVYQRPQHLMSRFARRCQVLFMEEPVVARGNPTMTLREAGANLTLVVPALSADIAPAEAAMRQRHMLDEVLRSYATPGGAISTWYYTPMALEFSRHLAPDLCVYDCMDELSGFMGAPQQLREL